MSASPRLSVPDSTRQEFLDRQPTYWLKRSYQAVRRLVEAELRPFGVSLSQRDALLALANEGPMSLNALAASIGLEQSSASRLVLGLQRRGMVASTADERDRRSRRIVILPKGAETLEQTPGASRIAGTVLSAALTPAELEQLIHLLRKATGHLESTDIVSRTNTNPDEEQT